MLQGQSAREIRQRLLNPPGGRESDEREITSETSRRRLEVQQAVRDQMALRAERTRRAAEMLTDYRIKLNAWIDEADFEAPAPDPIECEIVDQARDIPNGPPPVTLTQIIRKTCDFYSLHRNHIGSRQRTATVVHVHQIIMFLGRQHTLLSSAMIGARLNRDHTTVLFGFNKVKDLLARGDAKLIADIAAIRRELGFA